MAAAESNSEAPRGAVKNVRPLRNCEITAWVNVPGRLLNPSPTGCANSPALCVTQQFSQPPRRRASTFPSARRRNILRERSFAFRTIRRNLEYPGVLRNRSAIDSNGNLSCDPDRLDTNQLFGLYKGIFISSRSVLLAISVIYVTASGEYNNVLKMVRLV